ncbi:hypothetical protein Tco_1523818 [Tanacetum coccineum]
MSDSSFSDLSDLDDIAEYEMIMEINNEDQDEVEAVRMRRYINRNGLSTSLWYDMWCSQSALNRFLTLRDITREGFSIQSKVVDLMTNGTWNWPLSWLAKAPNLMSIAAPTLVNQNDRIQ